MKRINLILSLCLLSFFSYTFGQSEGDYQTRAGSSWTSSSTWSKFVSGAWQNSTDSPPLGSITMTVTINHSNVSVSTANMSGSGSGAIIIGSSGTLNISGRSITAMPTITVNGNLNMTGAGAYIDVTTLTINGTLTTNNYANSSTLTIGSSGKLRTSYIGANGWWSSTNSPSTITLTGTVEFSGSGSSQIIPSYTYYNLTLSTGNSAKTLLGDISVTNVLTLNASTITLNLEGHNLTLSGQGIQNTGKIQPGTVSSGLVLFNGEDQSISGSGTFDFPNLQISSSTKTTLNGSVTVNDLLTIDSNSRLSLNGYGLTLKGTGIELDGTLESAGESSLIFDGGPVEINGAGSFSDLFSILSVGPESTTDVTLNNASLLSVETFTISPGSSFTIGSSSKVDVRSTLDTGTEGLIIKAATSSPYICGSLIIDPAASVIGNIVSELYLTGGGNEDDDNFEWHYISSPVSSVSTDIFTSATLNLAQYAEPRVTTEQMLAGWVCYDGYLYSPKGNYDYNYDFTTLDAGRGYNFWDNVPNKFTISGSPNISDVIVNLDYSGNSKSGFNLLGNPFTSGLSWDDVDYAGQDITGAIYFTRSNVSYSYNSQLGNPYGVTGVIPPMQGFFVKTNSSGNSITLPTSARTHNDVHERYKGIQDIPHLRLRLQKNNQNTDETVIRLDSKAKSGFDYEFDAYKLSSSSKRTQIYSTSGGTNYSINGQPFPETSLVIPITMNITKDTTHTLSAFQINNLDNYNIYLKDLSNGTSVNLKSSPNYMFTAGVGTLSNRFQIEISLSTTGIESPEQTKAIFNIYSGNSNINIQTLVDEWDGKPGSVRVIDLTGKTVAYLENTEFSRNSLVQLPFENRTGLYVVEIKSGLMRYTGKVIVK
jgi:hypothetical protein